MRQYRPEHWNVWYPKARAAYEQITPDMPSDKILECYENVPLIPSYTCYLSEEIGEMSKADTAGRQEFYLESVRLFKEEFGDSEEFLAIARQNTPPVFFIGSQNLDSKVGVLYVCSISASEFGKSVTYRKTLAAIQFQRRSFLSSWFPFNISDAFVLLFIFILAAMFCVVTVPWFIYHWVKWNRQSYAAPGWGWRETKSEAYSLLADKAYGKDFDTNTKRITSRIFSSAFHCRQSSRGANVMQSQTTGQGMPPRE